MREFFLKLFYSGESSVEITLFSVWHILYYIIIIGSTLGLAFFLNGKSEKTRTTFLNVNALVVIGLYVADFFIMPLSQGKIDIDKLPFHICTLTGVFVPIVQFVKKFGPIKDVVACFAIVGSLMYMTYPGTALGGMAPWCYKVLQTFLFHGSLFCWGVLSVTTKSVVFSFKKIWKEAVGIVALICWAFLGNYTYSSPDHHYDWFFVTGSSFPFVPEWLMPFVVFVCVFGMCAIIHLIDFTVKAIIKRRAEKPDKI